MEVSDELGPLTPCPRKLTSFFQGVVPPAISPRFSLSRVEPPPPPASHVLILRSTRGRPGTHVRKSGTETIQQAEPLSVTVNISTVSAVNRGRGVH